MSREASAVIVFAILALALALMAFGWWRRRRRQADIGELATVPAEVGEISYSEDLLYVATTRAGSPYDRIAVRGLGFRSRAVVSVAATGIVLDIASSASRFIPAADLDGVGRATWTIDRVVEKDGLVLLGWRLGDTALESYFRGDHPDRLVDAITPLVTPTSSKEAA